MGDKLSFQLDVDGVESRGATIIHVSRYPKMIIEFGKDAEKYFMDPLKVQTSCLVIIAELYRA